MPLILDTHYVYALAGASANLRKGEREFLVAPDDSFLVSAVSIWEIALKWRAKHASGARKGPVDARRVLDVLATQPVQYLSLTAEHSATELAASLPHPDPFDELLLAQAQAEGALLLTRDANLRGHPLVRAID